MGVSPRFASLFGAPAVALGPGSGADRVADLSPGSDIRRFRDNPPIGGRPADGGRKPLRGQCAGVKTPKDIGVADGPEIPVLLFHELRRFEMDTKIKTRLALSVAFCAALSGCSSLEPVAYRGIASSSYLTPNSGDDANHIPYRYATQTDWASYNRIILEPVKIYGGPDNQFGDLSEEDKADLAQYMQTTFQEKLSKRFAVVDAPAPHTLRLKLTLTGAKTNTPFISTLAHIDMGGNLYNGVQAVRGGEGAMTGSVIYAVEIFDAPTNRLLTAYVAKQYPNAMNLMASVGSLAASKSGVDSGSDMLLAQLK